MAPAPALAGAWIAPEGGQSIWTEIAGQREGVFYSESSYYLEAPINPDLAFVAAPWVTQGPEGEGFDALRWEVTLAGKAAVMRTEASVMALQGGLVWYSDPESGCGAAAAEARWLGGLSFADGRGFANLEAAERAGEGGCRGERGELTLGYRPRENWLGMVQLFADARSGEAAVRAQLSLVRFGASGRGLQLGVRARLDGESAEPALVLAFWGDARD